MNFSEPLFGTHFREAWATFKPMLDNFLDFLAWGERKSNKTVKEGVKKAIIEYGEVLQRLGNENYCLCCNQRAQQYGSAWFSQESSGSCSKEVCVLCLESGHQGCWGSKLKYSAHEIHDNCEHTKRSA